MERIALRAATTADLDAINDIYSHYVLTSTATYQITPEPIEGRHAWFAAHGESHPVIVAEVAGAVRGWAALSPFHTREAYQHTVEDSVYVHHDDHRRGLGAALLEELITLARRHGHHAIIAHIDSEQAPSLALHERFGFARVGELRAVGYKFGRWLDVVCMQRML